MHVIGAADHTHTSTYTHAYIHLQSHKHTHNLTHLHRECKRGPPMLGLEPDIQSKEKESCPAHSHILHCQDGRTGWYLGSVCLRGAETSTAGCYLNCLSPPLQKSVLTFFLYTTLHTMTCPLTLCSIHPELTCTSGLTPICPFILEVGVGLGLFSV